MSEPAAAPSRFDERLGGVKGMIDSGLPVVAFVAINALATLGWAIVAALTAGAVVFFLRLVRRERVQFAIVGFLGVGVAVFFAHRSHSASGFFIPGIALNAVYFLAFATSLLIRRPLVGVAWTYLGDGDPNWRDQPRLRRAYTLATLLWTAMYAAKTAVQALLLANDKAGWLAVAKLSMGYPLFALAIVATVWLIRRAKVEMAAASPGGDAVETPTVAAET